MLAVVVPDTLVPTDLGVPYGPMDREREKRCMVQ